MGMKTKNPSISIVMANYNGERYLRTCLTSLLKSSFITDYEILVIDNNSTDDSLKIIREFQKRDSKIKILKNRINKGVPFSRNKAIKKARGDILVLLDNDTKVDKNWLKGIVQTFSSDETIGALQCKIFDFKKVDIIQEVGMKLYPYTGFGTPIGRGEKDHGQYETSQEIIALGAALAVRKEAARRIGGFDLKLMHTTDDLDFSWRIWIVGLRVVLAPNSWVYHYTKIHKSNYKMYFHLSKNSLRMIIKNYEFFNMIKFLPLSLAFNIIGGIYVLFTRRSLSGILGVLLGIIWNLFNLVDTLNERSKVQKLRRVRDKDIFSKIMISTNIFSILRIYFQTTKTNVSLMENKR